MLIPKPYFYKELALVGSVEQDQTAHYELSQKSMTIRRQSLQQFFEIEITFCLIFLSVKIVTDFYVVLRGQY